MTDHVFAETAEGGLRPVFDFDALYSTESDPWSQSGEAGPMADYYRASRARLVSAVQRLETGGTGLEIGCGHGHVAALLFDLTGPLWEGLDISAAAVAEARRCYPALRFHIGDVRDPGLDMPAGAYDVVLLNQVLWYVLARLDDAIVNCLRLLRPGGSLLLSQAFLHGPQRYGAEIADGFGGAVALFHARYRDRLRLIEARYDDRADLAHCDGLLAFRKVSDAE